MNWNIGLSNDWFVAAYAGAERRDGTLYTEDGAELARYRRYDRRAGLDLGRPWGPFGEVRLGLVTQRVAATPTLVGAEIADVAGPLRISDVGARLAAVIDQLDFASFPTRGYRLIGRLTLGEGSAAGRFQQLEGSALGVTTFGAHSFSAFGALRGASQREPDAIGRYTLGGFHQLSGYRDDQLLGDYVAFTRLTWYWRLPYTSLAARGLFFGATVEAGNAWANRIAVRDGELRSGMSVFLGADTGLGPLYLGLTHAPRGQTGVALFLGRP